MNGLLGYLTSMDPAKVISGIIGLVLLWVFRAPIGALRNRKTSQENAVVAQTQVAVAEADLEVKEYRRADGLVERYLARAERAEKARDEAMESKRLAIEDAQTHLQNAREDVHTVRNQAMVEIETMRQSCQAEIKRVEHAAQSRVAEVQGQMQVLLDTLKATEALVQRLTLQNEDCVARNQELIERLEREYPRARFDPSKSDVENKR